MCKYLFLNSLEHVNTWINGGSVPINPASMYRSTERVGTKTPDEVMQKSVAGGSLLDLLPEVSLGGEGAMEDIVFTNCTFNERHIPGPLTYSQHPEDALILCMSKSGDKEIMQRLDKVACVLIPDVEKLRAVLDKQIGYESEHADVQYTEEPGNRNHFLKGTEDSWQQEYRFVWRGEGIGKEQRWVTIPAGLARLNSTGA
jgi:hypothetical protein